MISSCCPLNCLKPNSSCSALCRSTETDLVVVFYRDVDFFVVVAMFTNVISASKEALVPLFILIPKQQVTGLYHSLTSSKGTNGGCRTGSCLQI
jgi:hypothetical protein